MTKITTQATVLRSGAVSVTYSAGRVFGGVMFDEHGRYTDATRQTQASTNRGFCEMNELPAGVLAAAREARRVAVTRP